MSETLAVLRAVGLSLGPAFFGWTLVLAGGLVGLAPLATTRAISAVRLRPAPHQLSADTVRWCRITGFLLAALGLGVLMPAFT